MVFSLRTPLFSGVSSGFLKIAEECCVCKRVFAEFEKGNRAANLFAARLNLHPLVYRYVVFDAVKAKYRSDTASNNNHINRKPILDSVWAIDGKSTQSKT